jgi:hypothetical protein
MGGFWMGGVISWLDFVLRQKQIRFGHDKQKSNSKDKATHPSR